MLSYEDRLALREAVDAARRVELGRTVRLVDSYLRCPGVSSVGRPCRNRPRDGVYCGVHRSLAAASQLVHDLLDRAA